MHNLKLTGLITHETNPVRLKASIHAGLTGLTGLTGCPRVRAQRAHAQTYKSGSRTEIYVRVILTTLTLITLLKPSIHAGLSVTGFASNPVID